MTSSPVHVMDGDAMYSLGSATDQGIALSTTITTKIFSIINALSPHNQSSINALWLIQSSMLVATPSIINACRLIQSSMPCRLIINHQCFRATENALSKEMRGEGGAMETRLHTSIASLQALVGRIQVRLVPVPMTNTSF